MTIAFDSDAPAAAGERAKVYADAAKGRFLVAGAHLPFPGLGHLRCRWQGLGMGAGRTTTTVR